MDVRRFWIRSAGAGLILWLVAAGAALADPPSKEAWPEIDTWLRLSPAWRLSVFVPLSENLETHYREGNLIPQVDYAFGKAHLERRLMDEDRARAMKIFLLRGGYLGGKSLGDDGEGTPSTPRSANGTSGFRSRVASCCRTGCGPTFAGWVRTATSSRTAGATG